MSVIAGTNVTGGLSAVWGTGFTLEQILNPVWRSDYGTTTADTALEGWFDTRDQYEWTKTVSGRPTLVAEDPNFKGKPSVQFGGSDFMNGPSALAALFNGDDVPFYAFWVFRRNGGAGADFLIDMRDSGATEQNAITYSASPDWQVRRSGSGQGVQIAESTAFTNAETNLWGIEYSGTSALFRERTADITDTGACNANALADLTLCTLGANTGGTQAVSGNLVMLGFRPGIAAPTTAELLALSKFCHNTWRSPKP